MLIVTIDAKSNSLASASVYTDYAEEGEEAAIAFAIASTTAKTIVSDYQTALRNYEIVRISTTALRTLRSVQATPVRNVQITWTPADASLPGSKLALEAARGFRSWDCPDDAAGSDEGIRGTGC